ncbi:DHHC palmitoyltransferase-domain-containing protein [Neurospora crassa]|nr:DHHC palmitoyltransferase-domain-containing protein [Neurospora crassa]
MTNLQTGPTTRGLQRFAIPAVCGLIIFLGYYSQYLFNTSADLAPGPLTRRESIIFNILLVCLWLTYYQACTVDPGRYKFPPKEKEDNNDDNQNKRGGGGPQKARWCKKCDAPKPPRAHHCRHCARCIPRMDHHCPWTGNCVSLQTFPHFLRFLVYTNAALVYFARLLWTRLYYGLWDQRHVPAYLGPSVGALLGCTMLSIAWFATQFALMVLLVTTVRSWMLGKTMIEEWEAERHETLLARSYDGDDYWGADGHGGFVPVKVEFPYDNGFWSNMAQAMGTNNFLRWFLPVGGGGPKISNDTPWKGTGWEYEENGFNDRVGMWPPPDPEKLRRERAGAGGKWPGARENLSTEKSEADYYRSSEDMKTAFKRRQQEDLRRRQQRRQHSSEEDEIMAELEEDEGYEERSRTRSPPQDGRAWMNSEGDTLWDYGVDVDEEENYGYPGQGVSESLPLVKTATGYNDGQGDEDEDVPLAELIRRRKVKKQRST